MKIKSPLIIGEALFDHFPNGQKILGGAPFNVAWNLRGFGLSPCMMTAVGNDDEGKEILDQMSKWGMTHQGVQIHDSKPTGQVKVILDGSQPSYEIVEDQAYDDLQAPDFEVSQENFSILYLGSLAYRDENSRKTIHEILQKTDLPRFVDVNIREPWFEKGWLNQLLKKAQWVKMNEDELSQISGVNCQDLNQIEVAVEKTREHCGGDNYLITAGSKGVYAITQDGESIHVPAPEPKSMKDTVGAGDAFASATVFGILSGWELKKTLDQAVKFAAEVCGLQGATSLKKSFYNSMSSK